MSQELNAFETSLHRQVVQAAASGTLGVFRATRQGKPAAYLVILEKLSGDQTQLTPVALLPASSAEQVTWDRELVEYAEGIRRRN